MKPPILYVFAISHYCEKARFALDHLGIEYTLEHLAPGAHMAKAKSLGAPGSSLPLLANANGHAAGNADGPAAGVVHGSSAILDWADARTSDPSKRLAPEGALEECRAIEARLDEIAGVHVRRYYYSEALVEHPETVKPIFAQGLSKAQRLLLGTTWPGVRKVMIASMDLGADQGQESRGIVERELDWLDGLLADGRGFLVGDRFSRADIAAASLFAPVALPDEHPVYGTLEVPPRAQADLAAWSTRPGVEWVREMYRRFR